MTSKDSGSLPTLPNGRTRYVAEEWIRQPSGLSLPRPPPMGIRSPNWLPWGHDLSDFYWIKRIPDLDLYTIWSRSMIKSFGENYNTDDWAEADARQRPRRRHPWPILKLPRKLTEFFFAAPYGIPMEMISLVLNLGIIDGGCEEHHNPLYVCRRRLDEDDDEADIPASNKLQDLIISVMPGLPEEYDVLVVVANDSKPPVMSPKGVPYILLWTPHTRQAVEILSRLSAPGTPPLMGVFSKLYEKFLAPNVTLDETGVIDLRERSSEEDSPMTSTTAADVGQSDDSNLIFPGEDEKPPIDSPYCTTDIPKLEEFIPDVFFPDVLLVHDPHNVAIGFARVTSSGKPKRYKRVLPKFPQDDNRTASENVAHLYLHPKNRLGSGNHSYVHKAPLTLPSPLSAFSRNGNVTVAAKTAYPRTSALELLENEGKIYSEFDTSLMEDWCGYNLVTPVKYPVPVGPVVPKFYGYYVTEDVATDAVSESTEKEDAQSGVESDSEIDSETEQAAPHHYPLSPILLMEECGKPVEPHKFSLDDRSECYSLMCRLHYSMFVQNSFFIRNIVVQPGPLTVPPEERSSKTPSFRIIDFGRAVRFRNLIGPDPKKDSSRFQRKQEEWNRMLSDEKKKALEQLNVMDNMVY
ncbi:hypothetical protein ABKN59_004756 [Abortiporus biennis]